MSRADLFEDTYNIGLLESSLSGAIRIVPAADIQVRHGADPAAYTVTLSGPLIPSEIYRIIIGPDLQAIDGTPLAAADTVAFPVEDLRITGTSIYSRYGSGEEVAPGREFHAEIRFNAEIEREAFHDAVRFEPPLEGEWVLPTGSNDSFTVRFLAAGSVVMEPEATYRLIVKGDVPLSHGESLGTDFERSFTVSPVRAIRTEPTDGAQDIPTDLTIRVTFNTRMDPVSSSDACRLETYGGTSVPGSVDWSQDGGELWFSPLSALQANELYRFHVSVEATDEGGHHLKDPVSILFRTGY